MVHGGGSGTSSFGGGGDCGLSDAHDCFGGCCW